MTKTTNHKLILWLPLLFMAFYTSFLNANMNITAIGDIKNLSGKIEGGTGKGVR